MSKNIGALIKKALKERGMPVTEFARRINYSRENVYSIFRRKSIDTALLTKISKVLDVDFTFYLLPPADANSASDQKFQPYKKTRNVKNEMIIMEEQLKSVLKENATLREKIKMLEKIIQLLEQKK
jgi:transcriptional regulator with XRE-family HTH domain